jgi:hypothetical protein
LLEKKLLNAIQLARERLAADAKLPPRAKAKTKRNPHIRQKAKS